MGIMMKIKINIIFVSMFLGSLIIFVGCNPALMRVLPKPLGSQSKNQIIKNYFETNRLDIIEGIWVWDTNGYEVAIVKNTTSSFPQYDYLGIITDSRRSGWQVGEIKLLLKKTVSDYIYSVIYYMGDKSDVGTTITMPNENMIEMYLPTGAYGSKEKTTLIRSYPTKENNFVKKENSIIKSGTGFFISNKVIATNYQVVADAKKIKLNVNSKLFDAKLLIKDAINDLALLEIEFLGNQLEKSLFLEQVIPLPFGRVNLVQDGDKAFTIGFPLSHELGKEPRVSEGIINSTFGINDDPRMFQISIPIQPGNSGGPLLNENGEVV